MPELSPSAQALARLKPEAAQAVATEAWLLRAGLTRDADADENVRTLAEGRPLMDYAAALVLRRGISPEGMSPYEVLKRAISFGLMDTLQIAARHAVLLGYDIARQTHTYWTGATTVKDFKAVELGYVTASQLRKIPHAGSGYDIGTLSGDSESSALETYGRIIQVGRRVMLSDDVEPFLKASSSFGASARIAEADVAYAALEANPVLSDGTAAFALGRGNLLTASSPSGAALGLAMAALRTQTDEEGRVINLTPSYLLVPAGSEMVARAAVIEVYGNAPDAPRVLAEPRLSANWYLVCAQTERPALHIITLSGAQGPAVSIGKIPGFDGEAVKCCHDFNAAVLSWRSAVKVPLA